ncbi:MAG: type II secretion system F family protein [Firmicutes bacterium]|nr:type II secretion system F family protein [Bacillota bacterium]
MGSGMLVFLTTFLGAELVGLWLSEEMARKRRRGTWEQWSGVWSETYGTVRSSRLIRGMAIIYDRAGALLQLSLPRALVGRIEELAERAGKAGQPNLAGKWVLASTASGLICMAGASAASLPPAAVLLLALLGLCYPAWVWGHQANARQEAILQELPFALDLLTIAVEAGQPFEQALQRVVQRTPGPLAAEFEGVFQQIQLGQSRAEALRQMMTRMRLPALRSLLLILIQADQLGTSIGSILRVLADQLREKQAQMAEEGALKIPVKLMFPLVLFIFPALLLLLLGPALLQTMP